MQPLCETMGIKNTWFLKLHSLPSYSKEAPGSGFIPNVSTIHRHAKSDPTPRLDDSEHREDPPGEMSQEPLVWIDNHHSNHGSQKPHEIDEAEAEAEIEAEWDPREFNRALRRLLRLGDEVFGKRLELKEKRNGLRHEHLVLAEIDSRFIRNVRQFQDTAKEKFDDSIYKELDAQRDVVGSLQYDYDQAEEECDVHENHFDQEGKNLLNLLPKILRLESNGEVEEESTSDSSSNSQPLRVEVEPSGSNDTKRARLMEYESRIGDARIVQEQLQDLQYERGRRLSISKKREKFGMGRNASDTSENLELRFEEAAKELSIINDDVQRLHEALELDGYSIPELTASEKLESPPAPPEQNSQIFSTQRQKGRTASEGEVSLLAQKIGALQDRVSRWMFVTFGDSPIEHIRHKVYLRELCSLDDEEWAHVVPETWTDDSVKLNDGSDPPVLRSGMSKAEEAVKSFERDFPLTEAPKDRATPYEDRLKFDLAELECRSN